MKSLICLLCIALFVGLFSCTKDVLSEPSSEPYDGCDCVDIPTLEGYSTGYQYEFDERYSFWPVLNPNHDNELIFCEWEGGNKTIYYYNTLTEEKTALYTGNIVAKPDWGKHNDIVFTLAGGTLWNMKPDGSDLTPLTEPGHQYHHVKFDDSGDLFMAYHAFVDVNEYYQGKVFDLQGTIIDSISHPNAKGAWSSSSLFLSVFSDHLQLVDVSTSDIVQAYSLGNTNKSIKDVLWLNDTEVVYSTYDGVFRLNMWSGYQERITSACSSREYRNGSLNQDGSKILYQKTILTPIHAHVLNERVELVWLDIVTGEETILFD